MYMRGGWGRWGVKYKLNHWIINWHVTNKVLKTIDKGITLTDKDYQKIFDSEYEDVNREIRAEDPNKIKLALEDGWVITFPRGTTDNSKPVRKGTAHIIKENKPLVVPITINGFSKSFDKKGLKKKEEIKLDINIKKPLKIDYKNETIDEIVEKISIAIEQHQSFRPDN